MGRPRASVCVKLRFTMRAPHHCRQGGWRGGAVGAARPGGGGRPPTASSAARPGPPRAPLPPRARSLNLGPRGGARGPGARAAGRRMGRAGRSHRRPSPPPWSRSVLSHHPPPSTAPAGRRGGQPSGGAACGAGWAGAAGPAAPPSGGRFPTSMRRPSSGSCIAPQASRPNNSGDRPASSGPTGRRGSDGRVCRQQGRVPWGS